MNFRKTTMVSWKYTYIHIGKVSNSVKKRTQNAWHFYNENEKVYGMKCVP